jgi:hypothetical protein
MAPPTVSLRLCEQNTFGNLTALGTQLISLEAYAVHNFSRYVSDEDYFNNPALFVQNADFCNITLTYTHPGQNDLVTLEAWLPLTWNGRLQAVGGGGWTAGRSTLSDSEMSGAIGNGW